jgi:hypothetical protein
MRHIVKSFVPGRMHTPTLPGTHMHAHTNMKYLLFFHNNNAFVNTPQCYVIRNSVKDSVSDTTNSASQIQ